MENWHETYRGTVPPWECDITEHFTIAYYFERLGESERNLADILGLREFLRDGRFPRRFDLRFVRELRAGAAFHIESAAIGVGEWVRLGHRFVDSATGETVTWVEENWDMPPGVMPTERRNSIAPRLGVWEGPAAELRPQPKDDSGFIPTARGRVEPADLNADSRFSLAAFVHRFTDGCIQATAAVGYAEASRRGFSTFELALRITGALQLDEPYLVESGIAHLGNSSMRLIHRMTTPRNGAEVARLGQFGVNLDLDARRPTAWPDQMRERAARIQLAMG